MQLLNPLDRALQTDRQHLPGTLPAYSDSLFLCISNEGRRVEETGLQQGAGRPTAQPELTVMSGFVPTCYLKQGGSLTTPFDLGIGQV